MKDVEKEIARFDKIYNGGVKNAFMPLLTIFLATVDESIRSEVELKLIEKYGN